MFLKEFEEIIKKSNNGKLVLGIFIGILIMLVIGLSGFIVYDKIIIESNSNQELGNNDSNKNDLNNETEAADNNEKKDEVIDLSLEDEFVKRVFKLHSYFTYGSDIVDYFYKNDKMIFVNLPKHTIEDIFIWDWLNIDLGTSRDDSYIYYNSTIVLNEWKNLVGSNMVFELYNDGDETSGYKFSSDGTLKKCLNCGWGDIGPAETENTLLRATKTDDEIVLYEAVKFMKFADDSDEALWYKDYNKSIATTEDEKIDANYKFIYKKDTTGNYYFYGVEKIK